MINPGNEENEQITKIEPGTIIPEEINEEIKEEITEVTSHQDNNFKTEFQSHTETTTNNGTTHQSTYEKTTSVYSSNSNTQKITKTVITKKVTSSQRYIDKSNSNENSLKLLNSDSTSKLEEFKSNENIEIMTTNNNDNSNLPSTVTEIKKIPKSLSRSSNSSQKLLERVSSSTSEKKNTETSVLTTTTTTNDESKNNEVIKENTNENNNENINENNMNTNEKNNEENNVNTDNTTTTSINNTENKIQEVENTVEDVNNNITQLERQQAGTLKNSLSDSSLNIHALTMTGTAVKLNNRSKSSNSLNKQSKILRSLTALSNNDTLSYSINPGNNTINPNSTLSNDILTDNSNVLEMNDKNNNELNERGNDTEDKKINKSETNIDIDNTNNIKGSRGLRSSRSLKSQQSLKHDILNSSSSSSIIKQQSYSKSKSNSNRTSRQGSIIISKSKSGSGSNSKIGSASSSRNGSVNKSKSGSRGESAFNSKSGSANNSRSGSRGESACNSKSGSVNNSRSGSRGESACNSKSGSANNSRSGSRKSSRKSSSRKSNNSKNNSRSGSAHDNLSPKTSAFRKTSIFQNAADINKLYLDKILLYNNNRNRIAYLNRKEHEEDSKFIIIQSSNTYDINPKDSTCIKEVSVKIEQNKDTEDLIKSLKNKIDPNICYTDYLDINRGNQYGTCIIQVREAMYKLIPCYYVSKKVSIKSKTNDQILYHLEFISYVTPKLETLNQFLVLQKEDGLNYNQHMNYDKANDNIIIEQYYYNSENTIKQLFDCSQYLSEGALEIMNRILINNETKPHTYNFLTFVRGIMFQLNISTYPDIKKAYFRGKRLPYPVIKIENEVLPRAENISIYEEVGSFRLFSDYQELRKPLKKEDDTIDLQDNLKPVSPEKDGTTIDSSLTTPNDPDQLNSDITSENSRKGTAVTDNIFEKEFEDHICPPINKNNSYDYTKHPHLTNKHNKKQKRKTISSQGSIANSKEKGKEEEYEEFNGIMLEDLDVPNFTLSNSQNNVTFEEISKNIKNVNISIDLNSSIGSCNLVDVAKNASTSIGNVTVDDINMKKGVIPTRKVNKKKNGDDNFKDLNYIETKICCPKRGCLIIDDDLNEQHFENRIRFNDSVQDKCFLDEKENLSIYRECKDSYVRKYEKYIKYHESLKLLLQDFIQSIFVNKPKDIYQYTQNYFSYD